MGKSTEVSHSCESELNAFPIQMFKNAKSFVIFGSKIQPRCDKHLYLCQLIIGTSADNRKSQRERCGLVFITAIGSDSVFQKNRTTERDYELNLGTNWAFNTGPVRLVYRYTA
jgi:hypothetical protein